MSAIDDVIDDMKFEKRLKELSELSLDEKKEIEDDIYRKEKEECNKEKIKSIEPSCVDFKDTVDDIKELEEYIRDD